MKTVTIYGPGCKRCDSVVALVEDAAARLGVQVEMKKVTDARAIAAAGVMSTPGLAIDGRLVHAGGLPAARTLEDWLSA